MPPVLHPSRPRRGSGPAAFAVPAALLFLAHAGPLAAQGVKVEEAILENGMKFLLVPRPGEPMIACGWVAKVGSVNERPGITGLAHLFEHMMFKGTRTIGTKDHAKEREVLESMDAVRGEIRREEERLIERRRRGEIEDVKDPKHRSEAHRKALAQFEELTRQSREFIVKDEFDKIYSGAGATGMNAGTSNDWTAYYIQVPANKLELWFWLESDRLLNAVFREFYSERDVVHEERRMRTDSTPLGKFQEQFNSLFWQASPYAWPVIGWPSDLEGYTREEALEFFDVYYAPNNLTACLVGDFKPEEAKALARRYFGRLRRGPRSPSPVRTSEVPQQAESRMTAFADTNPSVSMRYHTVADGHADEPALLLLGSLLTGRSGRLQKALVEEQKLASSVSAFQNGYKYEGYFSLGATARPGVPPEAAEKAIDAEMAKLKTAPVSDWELQKVKNQEMASRFRNLRDNFGLMFELLLRDQSREWTTITTDPERIQKVTAADIQRVAGKYFAPENRTAALYYRKGEAAPAAAGEPKPAPPAAGPEAKPAEPPASKSNAAKKGKRG